MQQTWHIFLKDTRRLRYEIAVMLVLTAAYAWSQGHWQLFLSMRTVRLMGTANMLRLYLVPTAWWFLASLAVYGEPLPGDRQFWVTRPYRWTSLLGSKLLFLVAFVSLPLLLADCFILAMQGLRPWENPVGFVWHELAIFAVVLLPTLAVACITAGFGQAVLVGLITVIPFLALGRFFGPLLSDFSEFGTVGLRVGGGSDLAGGIWEPLACLVLTSAALAIILLQYRARHTGVSRVIFAAAVLIILCSGRFLIGNPTFTFQAPLLEPHLDTSSITAVFTPESHPPPALSPALTNAEHYGVSGVMLPVRFDGVPDGTTVVVEMMLGEVTPPDGKPWNTLLYFGGAPPDTVWHKADVDQSLFDQVKGLPVHVHLNIQLTVLGDAHTEEMPLTGGPHRVPGVGRCESSPGDRPFMALLNCRAPFRQPAYVLARFERPETEAPGEHWEQIRMQWRSHYSPYPADFGIDPISNTNWLAPKGATTVVFTTLQPLAHIRRELEIPNVQLIEATP